jgi:hypothetical protein
MTDTSRSGGSRTRRIPAVTALAVAGYLALQEIVSALIGAITTSLYSNGSGYGTSFYLDGIVLDLLRRLVESPLSIGVGVFVTFAVIATITEDLRLREVVLRSFLATGIGGAIMFVVAVLLGLFINGRFATGMFGASFPGFMINGSNVAYIFIDAVGSVARALVSVAPIVVLAGIFQWMWCGRRSSVGTRVPASETGAPGQV